MRLFVVQYRGEFSDDPEPVAIFSSGEKASIWISKQDDQEGFSTRELLLDADVSSIGGSE